MRKYWVFEVFTAKKILGYSDIYSDGTERARTCIQGILEAYAHVAFRMGCNGQARFSFNIPLTEVNIPWPALAVAHFHVDTLGVPWCNICSDNNESMFVGVVPYAFWGGIVGCRKFKLNSMGGGR